MLVVSRNPGSFRPSSSRENRSSGSDPLRAFVDARAIIARVCRPTVECETHWHVGSQPLMDSTNEAGHSRCGSQFLVEVTNRLSPIDHDESEFTLASDRSDNLSNRQPRSKVVHGRQEQPVTAVLDVSAQPRDRQRPQAESRPSKM